MRETFFFSRSAPRESPDRPTEPTPRPRTSIGKKKYAKDRRRGPVSSPVAEKNCYVLNHLNVNGQPVVCDQRRPSTTPWEQTSMSSTTVTPESTASVKASPARPPVEKLAYRINDLEAALGLSRRAIERARSAGKFPKADRHVGRCPHWCVETIKAWLEGGEK
jgi:hypothetical protein